MKKKIIILLILVAVLNHAKSQVIDPSHWSYGLEKLSSNNYKIHILCVLDKGWHIYAQSQLQDAVAVPTKIVFTKNSGLTLIGRPAELGKKETYTIKGAGFTNYEYNGKVDFVQKVVLNPEIKEIKGTITYQTCTHEKCLTAQTINFTVPVP